MENRFKLIWKSDGGETFNIGELSFTDGKYYFQYNEENVNSAKTAGFQLLDSFPKVNVKYFREELFKVFHKWIGNKEYEVGKLGEELISVKDSQLYFLENE